MLTLPAKQTQEPNWDGLLKDLKQSTSQNTKPEESSLARRVLVDPLVSAAKGVVNVGQSAVGLADLVTSPAQAMASSGESGYIGKALHDFTGYDPERTNQFLEELYTPEQQAANQEVQKANGFTETLGAAMANPSVIPHSVIESLPLMFGGQAIGSKLITSVPKLAGGIGAGLEKIAPSLATVGDDGITAGAKLAASAMGEGALTSGSQAEQIRTQTEDGLLTPKQAAIAAGSGLATGAITGLSGGLTNRLGLGDVDTAFMGGTAPKTDKSFVTRGLQGALTEGVLEELPQSAQEQIASNLALNKPWNEGVGNAAAIGALTGAAQGGFTSAIMGGNNNSAAPTPTSTNAPTNQTNQTNQTENPSVQPEATPEPRPEGTLAGALHDAQKALPAPNTQLEFDRTARPIGNEIVFSDGSTSSTKDYYDYLISQGASHEQAVDGVRQAIIKSGQKQELPALPNLPKNAELVNELIASGYDESQAKQIVSNLENAKAINEQSKKAKSEAVRDNFMKNIMNADVHNDAANGLTNEVLPSDVMANLRKQAEIEEAYKQREENEIVESKLDRTPKPNFAMAEQLRSLIPKVNEAAKAYYDSQFDDASALGSQVAKLKETEDETNDSPTISPQSTAQGTNLDTPAASSTGIQEATQAGQSGVATGEVNNKESGLDANTKPSTETETGAMAEPSPSVSPTTTTEADAGSATDTLSTVEPETQPTTETKAEQAQSDNAAPAKPVNQKQTVFNTKEEAQAKAESLSQETNTPHEVVLFGKSGKKWTIQEKQELKKGVVGGFATIGEKQLTVTGRETTPFPNPKNKKTSSDIWLLENAMLEAQARGDRFNERIFKSDLDAAIKSKGKFAPQASKDFAEYYLFGDEQPTPVKSIFKDHAQPTTQTQPDDQSQNKTAQKADTQEVKDQSASVFTRSNRDNENESTKTALVANENATGRKIQQEVQRTDLPTFENHPDIQSLNFDAETLKNAQEAIEAISKVALDRRQAKLEEEAFLSDLEYLATLTENKDRISVSQEKGNTIYTVYDESGKAISTFTRQKDQLELNFARIKARDTLRNELVAIGGGKWDVDSLELVVQPLDVTAVNAMREEVKDRVRDTKDIAEKLNIARQAHSRVKHFDKVFKKLKAVFLTLFNRLKPENKRAMMNDDKRSYKWRNNDNTVMFTIRKGRGKFKLATDADIKGDTPQERDKNLARKQVILDRIAKIEANQLKRGEIEAKGAYTNAKGADNKAVRVAIGNNPVLSALFEQQLQGNKPEFDGFEASQISWQIPMVSGQSSPDLSIYRDLRERNRQMAAWANVAREEEADTTQQPEASTKNEEVNAEGETGTGKNANFQKASNANVGDWIYVFGEKNIAPKGTVLITIKEMQVTEKKPRKRLIISSSTRDSMASHWSTYNHSRTIKSYDEIGFDEDVIISKDRLPDEKIAELKKIATKKKLESLRGTKYFPNYSISSQFPDRITPIKWLSKDENSQSIQTEPEQSVQEQAKPQPLQDLIRAQDLPAILDHIIESKSSFSGIARILKNKLPANLKFEVVPELKAIKDNSRDIPAKFSKNDGNGNPIIRINEKYLSSKDKDLMQFILHELAHAETVFALETDKLFRAQLNNIIKAIAAHAEKTNGVLTAKDTNGKTFEMFKVSRLFDSKGNPIAEELVAYGLTDPRFQIALQDIPYDDNISVWDKFVDAVARVLGVQVKGKTADKTALAAVLRLSMELVEEQAKAVTDQSTTAEEQSANNVKSLGLDSIIESDDFKKKVDDIVISWSNVHGVKPYSIKTGIGSKQWAVLKVFDRFIRDAYELQEKAFDELGKLRNRLEGTEDMPEGFAVPRQNLTSKKVNNNKLIISGFENYEIPKKNVFSKFGKIIGIHKSVANALKIDTYSNEDVEQYLKPYKDNAKKLIDNYNELIANKINYEQEQEQEQAREGSAKSEISNSSEQSNQPVSKESTITLNSKKIPLTDVFKRLNTPRQSKAMREQLKGHPDEERIMAIHDGIKSDAKTKSYKPMLQALIELNPDGQREAGKQTVFIMNC